MELDFSDQGTPEGVPDFASGGVAVASPDFSAEGEPVSFQKEVMSPQPDLMPPNTLLEPWRYVPAGAGNTPGPIGTGSIDQERVRAVNAHFDELKDLVGPNQPEKAAGIEAARAEALRAEGVMPVSSEFKARLPRVPEASSAAGKIGAGLVNAGAGMVEGALDPQVLGMSLVMPARAVAAFFAVDMGSHVPAMVKETYKAVAAKDWQKASELAATTVVSGWLTKKLSEHAAGPGTTAHQFAEALQREGITEPTKLQLEQLAEARTVAPDFSRAGVAVESVEAKVAEPVQTFEGPKEETLSLSPDRTMTISEAAELNELRTVLQERGKLGRLNSERLAELEAKMSGASAESPAPEVTVGYADAEGRSRTVGVAPELVDQARAQIAKEGGQVETVDGKWEPAQAKPGPELPLAGDEAARGPIDTSEEARQARIASVDFNSLETPDPAQGRWAAIENTYKQQRAAEEALPGVAPKDIFMLDVFTKEPGKARGELVDRFFVERTKHLELMRELEKIYPADKFSQGLQPSSAAYKPRKGEPSYKEWMAGKRPDFAKENPVAAPAEDFSAHGEEQLPLLDPEPAAPRGGGVQGDPMDRGPVQASPVQRAPYPPGTPTSTLFDARVPVAMAKTTGKTVTIPEIMRSLENIVRVTGGETPIRTGRFGAGARGVFKVFPEVARLKAADNIPTATHEIAHSLQKRLFGTSMAAAYKGVPAPVKTELRSLGKALYGSTKPFGGYISEGFAEFIRHWVTTDALPKLAPHTVKWFEGELAKLPEVRKALSDARGLVDIYRGMGSVQRARMQLVKRPGAVARLLQVVKDSFSKKAMVDEFDALYEISKGYEKRSGSKLAPGEDPFLLATWKRGTAGAVVESMVDRGMQDLYGNPTGGLSLRQALAPVKGRAEDFALYLFGRRAVERWGKGKNPGISLEDSLHLVQLYDSPEFQLAAANYYEWNRGVLKYVAEANPAMAPTIDAILKSSKDYAPLARVIDPREASAAAVVARSNPLYRMKGSGRQVRDIFETTLENTSRLVSLAHRSMILDAVVKLSHVEGMGFLVEKVPRDRVKEQVSFEKVREQLEGMGVDTSAVGPDEALTFFSLAETPRGADPIVAVKDVDGVSWYHVSPGVFEALNGLEIYRLPKMLDLFMGAPARAFRLGTTGLRAAFSLVTNPLRDVQTFVMQTVSGANPAQLGAAYVTALRDVVRAGLGGKESGHVEAFHRLGANLAQPLGIDIAHTKRAARTLFHGKFMRVVTNPLDHLRELLSITEAAPRVAELKLIAERAGWTPGTKMTRDQAVEMAVAAKRVTVDFTAGGQIAKVINQAVPFFNASMQGSRSFLRTMRERPGRSVLWGVATLMVPSLLAWWQNKDKEWYRQLPWRERYLYDNIDDGKGNVWQIPRSFEWGNLFQVAPESILDSWYRRDPRGAFEGLKYIFDTTNPADWPVPLKVAKEQWQNRIDFFERPIVPRNQVDLPPGDQRGPYTTKLAQWIGDAFPNTMSPRRIDAAVRGFFGGAVPDLVEALGLGSTGNARDKELADVPVLGRLFRHGGEFSAANQAIADFYDDYTRLQARAQAESQYNSGHMDKLSSPLTPEEFGYWKVLDAEHVYFKLAADIANATPNLAARQKLYQEMGKEAEAVLKTRPK